MRKPLNIYENPSNLFVSDFVGNTINNLINAKGKFEKQRNI